jgi:hypothetical protein
MPSDLRTREIGPVTERIGLGSSMQRSEIIRPEASPLFKKRIRGENSSLVKYRFDVVLAHR